MWYSKFLTHSFLRIMVLATACSFLYIGVAEAEPKPDKVTSRQKVGVEKANPKAVTGTISYVDKKYVSIVTGVNADGSQNEIGFHIDESEQEGWRTKLKDMNPGDRIEIQFDEVEQDYDYAKADGTIERKTRIEKFDAKSVKFLSAGANSLKSDK